MKTAIACSSAVLFLALCSSLYATDDIPPALMWSQAGPGAGQPGSSGNVYYCGGVFNDGYYTGQLNWGPMAYARTQTGSPPTALLHAVKTANEAGDNGARSTVVIGDYIFFNRNIKPTTIPSPTPRVNRLNSDWTNNVEFYPDSNDVAPEGMTTDGTYLFTSVYMSGLKNVIRKYSISNQASSFSLTKTTPGDFVISGATTFRGLSYYDGKIYAVDNAGTKGIYEIDATTGAYTKLGTHIGSTGYQAVRYGNRLLVVDGNEGGATSNLTVYTITDGSLGVSTPYNLTSVAGQVLGLWGIGVVGTSTEVTGFWVNSSNGWVSFFSCSFSIVTCNRPFADADGDHDVDMDDFGVFQNCFSGTGGGIPSGPAFSYFCACFDKNGSTSVDKDDLAAFVRCVTGPAIPWVASEDCP